MGGGVWENKATNNQATIYQKSKGEKVEINEPPL